MTSDFQVPRRGAQEPVSGVRLNSDHVLSDISVETPVVEGSEHGDVTAIGPRPTQSEEAEETPSPLARSSRAPVIITPQHVNGFVVDTEVDQVV